jgi:glycosyltransferase involved in cell wall biosynthesis
MKIAIFCAYFYPHKGGVETYVKELFSGLKDIDVTIITSNSENSPKFEKKFGMNIYRFDCWHMMGKTYPIIKFSERKNIEKIIQDNKFDYIITQTRFFHTSYIGCKIAKKYHIPLIHFEHGTKHSPIKNPLFRFGGVIYDHTIGKYIIKKSNKVVGISHASEEFVKHLYKKAKTICIYNSLDTKFFCKTSSKEQLQTKKRLKIKDEKIIVFVGRIIFAKGAQDLLEAVKAIKNVDSTDKKEKIKVIIIGDGNYLNELKKKYPWAIFLGQKEPSEIIKYLSIADIFVNPSYAEGLPTTVLDAGAIGVPIIATNVGGTREIIDDGENGFLIEPKDIDELRGKIGKLLYDNILRKKFSKEIQKKVVGKFDWEKARKNVEKILVPHKI